MGDFLGGIGKAFEKVSDFGKISKVVIGVFEGAAKTKGKGALEDVSALWSLVQNGLKNDGISGYKVEDTALKEFQKLLNSSNPNAGMDDEELSTKSADNKATVKDKTKTAEDIQKGKLDPDNGVGSKKLKGLWDDYLKKQEAFFEKAGDLKLANGMTIKEAEDEIGKINGQIIEKSNQLDGSKATQEANAQALGSAEGPNQAKQLEDLSQAQAGDISSIEGEIKQLEQRKAELEKQIEEAVKATGDENTINAHKEYKDSANAYGEAAAKEAQGIKDEAFQAQKSAAGADIEMASRKRGGLKSYANDQKAEMKDRFLTSAKTRLENEADTKGLKDDDKSKYVKEKLEKITKQYEKLTNAKQYDQLSTIK